MSRNQFNSIYFLLLAIFSNQYQGHNLIVTIISSAICIICLILGTWMGCKEPD